VWSSGWCSQTLLEPDTAAGCEQASISRRDMAERGSGRETVGFGDQGTELKLGLFQKEVRMEGAAAPHVGNHGSPETHCRRSEGN